MSDVTHAAEAAPRRSRWRVFWEDLDIVKLLAILISAAFVLLLFYVIVAQPVVKDNVWNLVMVLGNAFLLLVGYYWGSSAGSKSKDDGNSDVIKRLTPPAKP